MIERVSAAGLSVMLVAVTLGGLSACAVKMPADRASISRELQERSGHALVPAGPGAEERLPAGLSLEGGLRAGEAVAIALWRNAALQEDLTALGFARADLLEAGMLHDPIFSLLFPVGPKQLEATLTWPFSRILQRPRRLKAARLDVQALAENLLEHGLALVRDTRVAHADVCAQQRRLQLAEELAALEHRAEEIQQVRLAAGEISQRQGDLARAAKVEEDERLARQQLDSRLAIYQLAALLGLGESAGDLAVICDQSAPSAWAGLVDLAGMLDSAYAARPDLRAAELALEAAAVRAGLDRSGIVALTAVLDFNEHGRSGSELGPGLSLNLPVGGAARNARARTRAGVDQAARAYASVKDRITLQVQAALARHAHALTVHAEWIGSALPPLESASRAAAAAHAEGDISFLDALDARRALLRASLEHAFMAAAVRRTHAELEMSIGAAVPLMTSEASL